MTDKPRRAWFQLHLSTAIVMMFVAGGLLWANLIVTRIEEPGKKDWYRNGPPKYGWLEYYGWPKPAFTRFPIWVGSAVWRESGVNETFVWQYAAIDVATAAAVLFATLFACEWLVRRREARAP